MSTVRTRKARSAAWGLCLLLLAAPAMAAPALDVAGLFAAALRCETDFPDAREPGLAAQLQQQGVTVLDRAPGENLDLLYVFAQPLQIAGTQVSSVVVRGGSGSIVAARASGDAKAFAQHMHLRPWPQRLWALDGYGVLQAQFARSVKPRPGLDESAPRLVMGRPPEAGATEFQWGCRSYDG